MTAVFAKCGRLFVLIALIFSVGGHWAFLQTAAWVGMTISYSQTESLSTAVVKTFDGRNPCDLCKFIAEGIKSEKKSEAQFHLKKLEVFSEVASSFYFPPLQQFSPNALTAFSTRTHAPPTPPPLSA